MNQALIRKNKPTLSFVNPSVEWDWRLLDSVSKRGSGHTPSKSKPSYYEGNIPWVSLADSDKLDQGIISETKYTVSQIGINNSSAVIHPAGTVLLSRDAGIGKSAVMSEDMAVSQHFITWTCNDDLNNWFLYYYLQTQKREFERIAVGSTIKTIGLPYFKKLEVPVPSRIEQDKIADFLGTVDVWLDNLRKQKTSLETYKRGMMQKIFTQQVRFKDDDGNKFPDWQEKTLGDLGKVVNGLTYSPNDIDEKGILVLRSSNVQGRNLSFNDNVRVKVNVGQYNPVKEDDILICVRNGSRNLIGKNALITKKAKDMAFGAFMSVYRSDMNKFLFQWFDSVGYKNQVHQNLGATINSINGSDLRKFKLTVPTDAEQQKIANFLTAIDETITAKKQEIMKAEQWKKGLMQKMFV